MGLWLPPPPRRPARRCGRPGARPRGHHEPLLRRLLLAVLLQLEPGAAAGNSGDLTLTHLPLVVSWIDVYARATCQPREVVVPLNMELMGTVAKQLVPSCVTVQRCGGCCPDDGLECVPTGQHQVRMQVGARECAWMDAGILGTEGWRPEPWAVGKVFSSLQPWAPRPLCPRCPQRRHFLRCQGRGLELNPDTCRCRKLRR
uniref:Platelet-derived growth factor (PDGF) family profile domain-containing protein n=1 Tax=Bos mutus grunniens TaxID=30521 RepID=A0A8B9X2R9_BOSMU